ncbi:thioesterase family protein [Tsukamurella strandjordii]|uniref:Thioesterase family protein n=1 Tax=Tsukamurella strandjordii TaxID=147577 RepID=A0AA90SP48_9ACTN|nr:thioesterase family protein [Tsukamurella strandjordii]MDP0396786.1 thioesterase family protein [Tsukamurella strandjordii]
MALFADLVAVEPAPGGFTADIDRTWSVGRKVHGGALLAVLASAGRAAYLADGGEAGVEPVVISAEYLGAPDPGTVDLRTEVIKRGRTTSVVNVRAVQGDRTYVQAAVTLARRDTGDERYAETTPLDGMPATPPSDALAWDPEHPAAKVFKVGRVAEVRYDPATLPVLHGKTGAAETRGWVRLREEPVSALFALLATDISLPVVANIGPIGWAPTLTLTAAVRREPVPGWLRFRASAPVVGQQWFEEDHLLVDEAGRVVASSRQLAMVPAADPGPTA